jgi:hypothetical protein
LVEGDFAQTGSYGTAESPFDEMRARIEELGRRLQTIDDEGLPAEWALGLAAALALWIFLTQLRSGLRVPRLTDFSFARPAPLAAQSGLGARASVLGAQTTSPVLALMELDAAIRDTLSLRLGLEVSTLGQELRARMEASGISSKDAKELEGLLSRLRHYGQSLTARKPLRPTAKELEALHLKSMHLISEIENTRRTR